MGMKRQGMTQWLHSLQKGNRGAVTPVGDTSKTPAERAKIKARRKQKHRK